jgi:NAD(P)H-dependent FMN reductase
MATDRLSEAGVTVERVDVSPGFPAFQPEAVDDPPHAVRMVRQAFEQADGLVFAVPEYAGGMPGWVKNITDWMVGSASMFERPVAVVSAATAGGAHAIEQLARTLTWQGAFVVSTCSIPAPLTIVRDGAVTDADALARLHGTSDALLAVLRGEADAAALTAVTLPPLGIDPLDRLI